jgi:fatty-acyl-CoA synthase
LRASIQADGSPARPADRVNPKRARSYQDIGNASLYGVGVCVPLTEVAVPVLSYVHGHTGVPLTGLTVGAFLDEVAEAHGDREALVSFAQGIRWSYAQLKRHADHFASGLLRLGLAPGDRLGIWSPNRAEWAVVQFAAAKAGLILVNINPAYRVLELEHVLRASGCKALVTAVSFKSSHYLEMIATLAPDFAHGPRSITSERLPALRHVIVLGDDAAYLRYRDVLNLGEHADSHAPSGLSVQSEDAVNIQFTSGTTGLPKGVTLSHHNLLNNGLQVGEATGIGISDRVCIPVPLYHCFGMVMGNLACLTHAATMVYPSEAFDALEVLRCIEMEHCTHLYGVPTMFISILGHEQFRVFDLSSLRGGIMAGAPCPTEVMKAVMAQMNMTEVTIAYGMTETSPVSFQTRRTDALKARVETVGRIMPHLEVKIVDEQGRIVPRGEPGELCTRGYSVMSGYWGEEQKTREVLDAAGWMHSGDLATIDAEGYCRITGRIKDLVIRGGENISPREVEEFLYRHQAIRDVQVIGVPDEEFGEELCACIILRSGAQVTEDDIRAFCRGQIAHFKIPRYIRFLDSFPVTATGKVQKYLMREQMSRELTSPGERAG